MVNLIENYYDADAIVTIEGKEYALYKKGPLKKYPYMVDVSTGGIPQGEQLPLLKAYLVLNGVNVKLWDGRGPHWYVRQAIKFAQGAALGSVSTRFIPASRTPYFHVSAKKDY